MLNSIRLLLRVFVLTSVVTSLRAEPPVRVETVWIGQPGNPADTTGFGAVAYEYGIGKYEITIDQYAAFLNAVAATDPHALYNPAMATDLHVAGIARSGGEGTYQYSVIGSGKRPISYVSWFDAARFCNWLHNGGEANADTEAGAYPLAGAMNGIVEKVPEAQWWIPTENEWYKAAFYHPAASGEAGFYSLYPTGSNEAPGNTVGNQPNQANYHAAGLALTGEADMRPDQNYLTDAGAFSGSPSAYGTFDQAGNVWEFIDEKRGDLREGGHEIMRSLRGGGWDNPLKYLPATFVHGPFPPAAEIAGAGIRVSTKMR